MLTSCFHWLWEKVTQIRFERIDTCKECGYTCKGLNVCDTVKKKMRKYGGIRFTADGFDCALPVAVDSHSICSYECLYCFTDNIFGHREASKKNEPGQTSLVTLENIFSGKPGKFADLVRKALKYDARNENGYPCPIQLGAICDPTDNIERQQGWLLDFIKLCNKYNQPVRISTKGNLFLTDEYLDAISEKPHLYWVAFSIITPDDERLAKIDRYAPSATERLKSMERLSKRGVKTSLRFRPLIPGLSDSTPKHPKAYRELIERAAEAGARAISTEVVFVPGMMTKEMKRKWREIEKITGVPIVQIYKSFGKNQACIRPAYTWTEGIMHAVVEEAKKNGMTVGVSDPVWKQLGETGCCCGILPDDPVFGNWQRESATNRLLEAKETGKEIRSEDIIPEWAYYQTKQGMCSVNAGPRTMYKGRHYTWADELRDSWNDLEKERGALSYFQGALVPVRKEGKEIVFKYKGLERQYLDAPYWKL